MSRLVIYVVDDEWNVANATASVLRTMGHQVAVETEPTHAMAMLESDAEIDLIILDLLMPDMTGIAMYERCGVTAPARRERIMFLTGFGDQIPTLIKRTSRLCLEKPVTTEKLAHAIDQYAKLKSPRGPRYPAGHPRPPSVPDLMEIDDDEEEVTGITRAVRAGDPFARRLQEMLAEFDKRMTKVESHFENNPTDKKFGMVTVMYNDMDFIKRSISFWPKVATGVAGLLTVLGVVATWWLSAHQPPPVDYARMRQEFQKVQHQEQPKEQKP